MKRSLILFASLTTALTLAGCGQSDDGPQAGNDGGQTTTDEAIQPENTSAVETTEDIDAAEEDEGTEEAELQTLEGSVTYRERIALPDDAELTVQLRDVSLADAASETLVEVAFMPEQQVPIDFAIEYDANIVATDGRYAVHAEIHDADGALLWTTVDHYGVELGDEAAHGPLEIVLHRVAGETESLSDMTDEAAEEDGDDTADEVSNEEA